jgi:ribosome-associated heat shock protein Hsp15
MADENKDKTRIDKYLWAIRIFKTRSLASDACKAGRVKLESQSIKASYVVKQGDIIHIQKDQQKKIVKVIEILDKRVDAPSAQKYYEDLSPVNDTPRLFSVFTVPVLKRDRGSGRPTKKDRREIDDIQSSWEGTE